MNRYVPAELVQLVISGRNYFDTMEELINAAKQSIHLQTYIFEEDNTGNRIANALKNAARRGVSVYVMADGFGSNSLSLNFINDLTQSGVNFRFFAPIFSSENLYFGRRLHHKVIVADKNSALVGGINIADKYSGRDKNTPWLDYSILVKGQVCIYLHILCENLFNKNPFIKRKKKKLFDQGTRGNFLIRFRRNDWIWKKNEIHHSYREALTKAESSVIIIASYFLPGFLFRRILRNARKRGVEITLVLTRSSDVKIIHSAERYLYSFLLRNKIKIFEWPNSMMHGKATIADNDWVTIGSYNINQLSHYRSIELNADIKNQGFAKLFRDHIEQVILADCNEITNEKLLRAGYLIQLVNFLSYHYVKLISYFFLSKKPR